MESDPHTLTGRTVSDLAAIGGAEAVLLDGPASGQVFDWHNVARVPHLRYRKRLILAGGLDAGNVT